jgi:hypothetical protein
LGEFSAITIGQVDAAEYPSWLEQVTGQLMGYPRRLSVQVILRQLALTGLDKGNGGSREASQAAVGSMWRNSSNSASAAAWRRQQRWLS